MHAPKSPAIWNSVPTMLVVVCVVLLVALLVMIQMSYWPRNALKSHSYRRVNTQDEDEDKMLSVKIPAQDEEATPNEAANSVGRGSQIV